MLVAFLLQHFSYLFEYVCSSVVLAEIPLNCVLLNQLIAIQDMCVYLMYCIDIV